MNLQLEEIYNFVLDDTVAAALDNIGYSTIFNYETTFDNGIHIWVEGEIDGYNNAWAEGKIISVEIDGICDISDDDYDEFVESLKQDFKDSVNYN